MASAKPSVKRTVGQAASLPDLDKLPSRQFAKSVAKKMASWQLALRVAALE
jgi:hypothetical protein